MISADTRKKLLSLHLTKAKKANAELDTYIQWYLGEGTKRMSLALEMSLGEFQQGSSADEFRIDTNYVYAFIDTMMAVICPSNPQISITVNRKDKREIGSARESLANHTMRQDKLRMKSRRLAMFASLAGHGFSKTVWNFVERRIETIICHPKCVFHDPSVPFDKARYVIEAVPMTEEEFMGKVNHTDPTKKWTVPNDRLPTFDKIPSWMTDGTQGFYDTATYEAFRWAVVYEFHDLTSGMVSFWLQDAELPLWEGGPMYTYMKNPYSKLIFNENPLDESGISDAKLIARHQERLNEVDALELWHTFTTIPICMVNNNMLENPAEFKSAMSQASGPGDMVDANLKSDLPLDGVIKWTQTPSSLPAFDNMRDRMTGQIEFILGLPQYSRGAVGKSDLATEMALADTATRTRNGTRIDLMNGWVTDVAMKYLALWKEFFPEAGNVSLPGRSPGSEVDVSRMELGFDDKVTDATLFNEDWWFNYEVVASSPAENNKAVQIQRLEQFLPLLLKSGADAKPLLSFVGDLLGLKHVLQFSQPMNPALAGGAPTPAGPEPGSPASQGIPINGALPEGQDALHESMLPPGSRALASQPKMDLGGL